MTSTVQELATKVHVLRLRAHRDERALAIAYPDQRAALEQSLENANTQLAELDHEVEAAMDAARAELLDAVNAFFTARDTLLKLNGWFNDPGFKDLTFSRCAATQAPSLGPAFGADGGGEIRCDPTPATEVRAALLRAAELKPAPEPAISETQRIHEERVRNERAGRGYFTDDQIADIANRGEAAMHGAGWSRVRRLGE